MPTYQAFTLSNLNMISSSNIPDSIKEEGNPKGKVVSFNSSEKTENNPELSSLKDFLRKTWDFQFNSVAEKPTFKNKNEISYTILEDYHFNTIYFQIKSQGVKVGVDTLRRLLESEFSERVNPVRAWIENLPVEKGTVNIKKIIATVEFEDEESREFFIKVFPKWFVALVANVFDETRCTNHTCLVFTGEQGKRKTTWFNSIIPEALEAYKFNGKIDPNSKDTLALVHSKLLMIIDDQLKQINKKDENDIKELITKDKVNYRRPFAVFDITRPHLASFAATVNGDDFLTDASGSRRFLSFHIENCNIDELKKVDLPKAYSEAYQEYLNGFRYWFTDEEIKEIDEKNQEFTTVSIELELIEKLYDLENPKEEFYSAGEIKLYIEGHTKDYVTSKRIGEAMNKLGIRRTSIRSDNNKVRKKYRISKRDFLNNK
jgi:predicted P-loop ATPase